MNDVSKTNIKNRLEKSMEHEGLRPSEVARIFGIHPNYISTIRNPNTWVKCPNSAWDSVLLWVNSGQGLIEWSEKHGKVLPEKPNPENITPDLTKKKAKKAPSDNIPQTKTEYQKISIDIEITLIINGKRIVL